MNEDKEIVFFWKDSPHTKYDVNCFSQWYPSIFVVDGVKYKWAEQYMMARKAELFNDNEALNEIMLAKNPRKIKELGRKVKNFDINVWNRNCERIVFEGNYAKFSQNYIFEKILLDTKDKMIAEASPIDCIWGIGMAETDEGVKNPLNWKGKNLLGKILMDVRDKLRKQFLSSPEMNLKFLLENLLTFCLSLTKKNN